MITSVVYLKQFKGKHWSFSIQLTHCEYLCIFTRCWMIRLRRRRKTAALRAYLQSFRIWWMNCCVCVCVNFIMCFIFCNRKISWPSLLTHSCMLFKYINDTTMPWRIENSDDWPITDPMRVVYQLNATPIKPKKWCIVKLRIYFVFEMSINGGKNVFAHTLLIVF